MKDKLTWYVNRWRRMIHPYEELDRLKQLFQNQILDRYSAQAPLDHSSFTFNTSIAQRIMSLDQAAYQSQIRDHYPIFQSKIALNENQWRKDPKSKITSPILFKAKLNYKNYDRVGESKYAFELNRLHVIPILAYASTKEGKDQYLGILHQALSSWEEQNPYLRSIHWTSGIEVAIRSVNLIFTRLMLGTNNDTITEIDSIVSRLCLQSMRFLKTHLSRYSSANNHLLMELMGIILIAATFDYPSKQEDLKNYYTSFQEELLKLSYTDGGLKEQSSHYHAVVLQGALLMLHFTQKLGLVTGDKFLERLQQMLLFLDIITFGGNRLVHIGDKDDSKILCDVFDDKFNLYTSVLTLGRSVFPGIDYDFFPTDSFSSDFTNSILRRDVRFPLSFRTSQFIEKKSNYYFLRESGYFIFILPSKSDLILFDVGSMGLSPLAAHGHSDLLHFTYWKNNLPVIADSGTYQYHSRKSSWRNYFRGIRAHNTISVNGNDHATSLGTMMWDRQPRVQVLSCGEKRNLGPFCEAQHQAFPEVVHKRQIECVEGGVKLIDKITRKRNCLLTFYLHFHPKVTPQLLGDTLFLVSDTCKLWLQNEHFVHAKLTKGDKSLPLGWYSNSYDKLLPTFCLHFSIRVDKDISLTTFIKEKA